MNCDYNVKQDCNKSTLIPVILLIENIEELNDFIHSEDFLDDEYPFLIEIQCQSIYYNDEIPYSNQTLHSALNINQSFKRELNISQNPLVNINCFLNQLHHYNSNNSFCYLLTKPKENKCCYSHVLFKEFNNSQVDSCSFIKEIKTSFLRQVAISNDKINISIQKKINEFIILSITDQEHKADFKFFTDLILDLSSVITDSSNSNNPNIYKSISVYYCNKSNDHFCSLFKQKDDWEIIKDTMLNGVKVNLTQIEEDFRPFILLCQKVVLTPPKNKEEFQSKTNIEKICFEEKNMMKEKEIRDDQKIKYQRKREDEKLISSENVVDLINKKTELIIDNLEDSCPKKVNIISQENRELKLANRKVMHKNENNANNLDITNLNMELSCIQNRQREINNKVNDESISSQLNIKFLREQPLEIKPKSELAGNFNSRNQPLVKKTPKTQEKITITYTSKGNRYTKIPIIKNNFKTQDNPTSGSPQKNLNKKVLEPINNKTNYYINQVINITNINTIQEKSNEKKESNKQTNIRNANDSSIKKPNATKNLVKAKEIVPICFNNKQEIKNNVYRGKNIRIKPLTPSQYLLNKHKEMKLNIDNPVKYRLKSSKNRKQVFSKTNIPEMN